MGKLRKSKADSLIGPNASQNPTGNWHRLEMGAKSPTSIKERPVVDGYSNASRTIDIVREQYENQSATPSIENSDKKCKVLFKGNFITRHKT
jgi:hypothetical protein